MAALTDCPGLSHPLHPIAGFEQLTVSDSVKTLTVPKDAAVAIINVRDNDIYTRDDGTDVTTTVGTHHKADTEFAVCGSAMNRLTLIRDTGDAEVNISYYG
ncbi:hypothetical protein LCGC14_2315840, partial [marine sediment metagenome]